MKQPNKRFGCLPPYILLYSKIDAVVALGKTLQIFFSNFKADGKN
jgi:hypothetical protein